MPIVFLALGSNLGDRKKNIFKANRAISRWPKTKILDASAVIETRAVGFIHQPKFLNCVLKVKTGLSPMATLLWAKITEIALGRKPRRRWGPREMDIDILFYGRERIKKPLLQIPHPRIIQRDFIVKSLVELGYDQLR